MLSRRIARASPLRSLPSNIAARRLPMIQQRTFIPNFNEKIHERFPDYPTLTEAEDPEMVR